MRFISPLLMGLAAAVLVMAGLFAVNYTVLTYENRLAVHATLDRAIDDGTILENAGYGPFPFGKEAPLYRHDCLLWRMLAVPDNKTADNVFRNPMISGTLGVSDTRAPENPDCQVLLRGFSKSVVREAVRVDFYDRYILGQRALGALLLAKLPPHSAGAVLLGSCYTLLVLTMLVALLRWKARADTTALLPFLYALIFALFYGLPHFGRMLYFAPLDAVHFLMLLAATAKPWSTLKPARVYLLTGVYGALVAMFEFLTGGLPLGAALIVLLTAPGLSLPEYRNRLTGGLAAFLTAFAGCFAIKLIAVTLLTGENQFVVLAEPFIHRLHGGILEELSPTVKELFASHGIPPETLAGNGFYQLLLAAALYGYWSLLIGFGTPIIGVTLVMLALVVLVWASLKTRGPSVYLRAAWLAAAVLPVWAACFWNHTLLHPFFMARLLVVFLLAGVTAVFSKTASEKFPATRAI